MYYKFLNLGSKILTGVCFCAAMSGCGDTNSNSSNNSSNFEQLSPSTDVSSLQNALSKENISRDKVADEDLKMYEDMSKTISKEEVEKLLIQNYKDCEKQASSDVGKRKELFRNISQQCQACATAVALYSEGKTIYSQAEDRWTLYENIFPEFSKMWSKNKNIDKKSTVKICLNRLENNNKKIIENISKISMTLLGILKHVDTNCANVLTDVTEIKNSTSKFKASFQEVLQNFESSKEVQNQLSESLEKFSKHVTDQVTLVNDTLLKQSSTLDRQSKNVKNIPFFIARTHKSQTDTYALLEQIQQIVANLEKELKKNTQDPTSNVNISSEEEEGIDDDFEGFGDLF